MALSACEDRETKAERYYQSALTLLEADDVDRAMVELRNVFQNDGFHHDARQLYADLLIRTGEPGEAYSQLLRLVEQYPDDVPARLTLAEMAIANFDWEEAERHGRIAAAGTDRPAELGPRIDAVRIALDYRAAILARNESERRTQAEAAQVLLDSSPDLIVAQRVVIDWAVASGDTDKALAEISSALAAQPESYDLNFLKLRLLADSDAVEETGAQLKLMVGLFPEDETVRQAMVRWYVVTDDLAGAEAYLREVAGPDTGPPEGHLAVVEFLRGTQGDDAAMAELTRLATANEAADGSAGGTAAEPADGSEDGGAAGDAVSDAERAMTYRATLEGLRFAAGQKEEAIQALVDLVGAAPPSDEQRRVRVILAQMLSATGDRVTARSHVEQVLAEDPSQVEALQLRAAWAIEEDRPADAIVDLRAALAQDPRNAQVLLLMAEAHERDGQPELAAERLAVAVEVSGGAPDAALRYANFLQRRGRSAVAESVLVDARTANPNDMRVASALGDLWIKAGQLDRIEALADELDASGYLDATATAQRLRAAAAFADNRASDGLAVLQNLAASGADPGAVAQLVQAMIADGQIVEARRYLDAERTDAPDDPTLKLLDAALLASEDRQDEALALLDELAAAYPGDAAPVQAIATLLDRQGRRDEATARLDAALVVSPDALGLLWLQAARREQAGDIAGAIEAYERMYGIDSSNLVVANNLASLITSTGDDPATLERAFVIGRRLAGTDEPAFQDTYGWILSQRGDQSAALTYLQAAATGLPDEPLVLAHLGVAQARDGQAEAAGRTLQSALDLAAARADAGQSPALDATAVDLARSWLDRIAEGSSAAPAAAQVPASPASPDAPVEAEAPAAGTGVDAAQTQTSVAADGEATD